MRTSTHLRQAIEWLGRHGQHDAASLEMIAQRFDLTPLEEDYLFREFSDRAIAAAQHPPTHADRDDGQENH